MHKSSFFVHAEYNRYHLDMMQKRSIVNKRTRHSENRRQSILQAAGRLFWEKGYLGTSIDDIAHVVKMNKASLYHYFPNKASILYEIVASPARELIDSARPIADSDSTAQQKLESLIKAHINWQVTHVGFAGIGAIERKNLPPRLLRNYTRIRDEYEEIFRKVIQEGVDRGEFGKLDNKISCLFVLGLVNSIIHWFREEGELSAEEIAEKVCKFIFSGLNG